MPASKKSARAKVKAAHRRAAEARGKDLDGVMYVRTILPATDVIVTRKRGILRKAKTVNRRDLILHTIDSSMTQLAHEGADLDALTIITIGNTNPTYRGEFVVEVKSKAKGA